MSQHDEPFSGLMEAMISQHEMYLSWMAAGFTEDQAMELLKVVITEIVRGEIS